MSMVRSAARWMSHSAIAFTVWASLVSVASGQSATPAEQWQALNQRLVEAYQAGQINEAVPLAEQALELARQAFGPRHPDTLLSMNNLAFVLDRQGRSSKAEPLYREALEGSGSQEALGPSHPTTLLVQMNYVLNLVAQRRIGEAVALQRQMEPQVLAWLGVELYSTQAASVRHQLVASQASYQNLALTLALQP